MLNTIISAIVSAVLGWLLRHFQEWQKDRAAAAADEAKTKAAKEANEKAQTPEERDNAAKGIADDL